MRNFDIFYFSWGSIFRLWPLIFIFWGIAVLPIKSGFKALLSLAAIALGLVLLFSHPQGGWFWNSDWNRNFHIQRHDYRNSDDEDNDSWEDNDFDEPFDTSVQNATLNLNAAAGSFSMNGTTDKLYRFKTEGNAGPFYATVDDNDGAVNINFTQKKIKGRDNYRNSVWMYLNENPSWTINIDVGAADLDMDLTPFKVEKIDIDGGASDIDLKLGDRQKLMRVTIDAGVSGLTIKVPESSACEVQAHMFLSGRDMEGFNKISQGLYQTPNFSDSANQIIIDIEAAISDLKVERY